MHRPALIGARACSAILALACALAACGGGDPAAAAGPPTTPAPTPGGSVTAATSCGLPNFAATVIAAVNAARAQGRTCGTTAYAAAGTVNWNDALFSAAAVHTQDMAARHALSHTGSNGSTLADRIDATGYAWTAIAENVAAGYGSVDAVMQGWLSSAGHCANLMNPAYTEIGVSCVQATGADPYGNYWTLDLARPR